MVGAVFTMFEKGWFSMNSSDVHIFLCTNCVPNASRLPRQWQQNGARVRLKEFPCSGKVDGQYVMRALEGGAGGLCVVTCPHGECHLAEGNRRADVRVRTTKKLLSEIGMDPDRLQLIHYFGNDSEGLRELMNKAVSRLNTLCADPRNAA